MQGCVTGQSLDYHHHHHDQDLYRVVQQGSVATLRRQTNLCRRSRSHQIQTIAVIIVTIVIIVIIVLVSTSINGRVLSSSSLSALNHIFFVRTSPHLWINADENVNEELEK